jgi:MraZ protein
MIDLLGEYESTVDAKGRFLLPAALRKQLPDDDNSHFVVNRGFVKCLTLYPRESWKEVSQDIGKLNKFSANSTEFQRRYLNGATKVELDAAGRMLLPKLLMEYANLSKEILVLGLVDKIEIWDKSTYQAHMANAPQDYLSTLANELMGGKKNEPNS